MKSSALHQQRQRNQSGQTEAEPTSYELVRIGQEEDAPAQRCDEHEEPGEATYTGRIAVVPPASPYPFTLPEASKLDLDLPSFGPADDLLQSARQRQPHPASLKQLVREF